MAITEPLNLQELLVNTFAGSMEIFVFLAFIGIGILAAMFRMPNKVALPIMVLFTVIMANFIPGIYLIVMLLVSLIAFRGIARVVKR